MARVRPARTLRPPRPADLPVQGRHGRLLRGAGARADRRNGRKTWESEFAEVALDAEHARDTITLHTHLRWPPNYERERCASLSVSFDELPKLAERVRALTGIPEGHRFIRPASRDE